MQAYSLSSGAALPAFGAGTWGMGERRAERDAEIAALRCALDLGVSLFDTAEMYADGGAEEVLGEALSGRREQAFIVSKVYPHNASTAGVVAACERSLRRLHCDHIDLYLLHWRGSVALADTVAGFQQLRDEGKIRDYGVSNFDLGDLQDAAAAGIEPNSCNQVLYSLARREAEWAVLPWCREHAAPLMAYCPIDQGGELLRSASLRAVAERHAATPAQVALAWLLHQQVAVIPKTSRVERMQENVQALALVLQDDDLEELERAHPGPTRAARLGII